jgi:succinate-acetate transporter protein
LSDVSLYLEAFYKRKVKIAMAHIPLQADYNEVQARDVANPAPLGLIILAFTTALVGSTYARFLIPAHPLGVAITGSIVSTALIYGGIIEILAGMWEFRKNNTLTATLFSAYGGFVLLLGALFFPMFGIPRVMLSLIGIVAFHHALALLYLCWTISVGVLLVASLRTSMPFMATLALLFLSYLFLFIGELANANTVLLMIGGWLGIVCALVAWYTALAGILQFAHSPFRLPTGPQPRESVE